MLIKNTVPVKYSDEKKDLKIKEFQKKLDNMENGNDFIINNIEHREGKDKSLYIRMYHKNCNNEFHTTSSKFFGSTIAKCPECRGEVLNQSNEYQTFKEFIKELVGDNFTENGTLVIIRDKSLILAFGEDTTTINGFRKIFISNDDWLVKENIIKNNLYNIIGTNRRDKILSSKCSVDILSIDDKNEFLEKFHIDGKDEAEICFGLIYTGQNYRKYPVALMSFELDDRGFKISRFATTDEKFVIGAFNTLLNAFKDSYNWSEIYATPNMNWINVNKNIYLTNGFTYDKDGTFFIRNN